uniref:protein SSUH2 homolog isoform X2 n=1 Tax=Doryrhamphus excisus TaxID=161450 RepID=UPI0025ADF3F8|nr:protein SSUH2 homolog isoform X2 [Doryrhamphus excisus]
MEFSNGKMEDYWTFINREKARYRVTNPGYLTEAEGSPAPMPPPVPEFSGPSAPPVDMFDNMPIFGNTVVGGGGFVPNSLPMHPTPQPQSEAYQQQWNFCRIPFINETTAREAIALWASSNCSYDFVPKDGVIVSMEAFNTYRYRLETFTESRSTEWSHEPYNGQPVDAYAQPPPGPWDIAAEPPVYFVDGQQIIRLPYTSFLKSCHVCEGMGQKPCNDCDRTRDCMRMKNCRHCQGQGFMECPTCKGRQQLLVYINLTVKWTNNRDDCVVEQPGGLKVHNLHQVSGMELFRDSRCLVYPVLGFPVPAVVNASQRLVSEHQYNFSLMTRILQQRQVIELIPVTKVTYSWEEKKNILFVSGTELEVCADNHPPGSCCTLM